MYGQRRCGVTEVVRSDRQAQCSRSRIEAVAAEIAVTQRRGVRGGENEIRRRRPQRTVIVAHADRRAQDHALRETVLHLGREIDDFTAHAWYESVDDDGDTRSRQGFMDLTDIPLPQDIQVFTCGPLPFMRHVRSTLLSRGVPAARIRYEVFGPDLWAAQTSSDSGS